LLTSASANLADYTTQW